MSFPRSSTTGADTRSYFSNALAACAACVPGVNVSQVGEHHVLRGRGRVATYEGVEGNCTPHDLARVDDKQPIGLVVYLRQSTQVIQDLADGLAVAHGQHIQRH